MPGTIFHIALDDTRHPARFVIAVVAEDETAARLACKLSRPFESIAWVSEIGPEDEPRKCPYCTDAIADAFNAGHALGMADARLEDSDA